MAPDDLTRTPAGKTLLINAERALTTTTRGAAAVGVAFVVLGGLSVLIQVLLHGPTLDAVLGGGGLIVGGGLWVVAQQLVVRWISDHRPRTLLLAALCGVVADIAVWFGWGTVVGFSWLIAGFMAALMLAEWALVHSVDPAWSSRGHGADAVETLPEMDEATMLRWLAQAALSLGLAAGVSLALQSVLQAANGEADFLSVYASVYLFGAVGLWCLPQVVLLAWAGGRLRHAAPVVLVGAVAWAALIWASSRFDGLGWVTLSLVGAGLVLEVAGVCMILWRRLG